MGGWRTKVCGDVYSGDRRCRPRSYPGSAGARQTRMESVYVCVYREGVYRVGNWAERKGKVQPGQRVKYPCSE